MFLDFDSTIWITTLGAINGLLRLRYVHKFLFTSSTQESVVKLFNSFVMAQVVIWFFIS